MLSVIYAECRKETHYAECRYAECLKVVRLSVELSFIQRATQFVRTSHTKCKDAVVDKSSQLCLPHLSREPLMKGCNGVFNAGS
jgi:hypothetical protein